MDSKGLSPAVRLKRGWKIILSAALLVLLNSCYLPLRFDAEVDLTRQGFYTMTFIGYMTDVGLFNDLAHHKLTVAQRDKKLKLIETDFKRTPNTKQFKIYDASRGIFKVRWEKSGDILRDHMVTFLQRNEAMLNIIYNKDKGVISVQGASMAMSTKKRLLNIGLNVQGTLTVKVDGKVLRSNAQTERDRTDGKRGKEFIWHIKSVLDPKPVILISFR